MSNVDGTWETVAKTPMGEQKSTMKLTANGDTFTGTAEGPNGTITIEDGKISGDTITWTLKLTSPMPITLEGEATIDGDTMSGKMKAGMMGSFDMSGSRVA